MRTPVARFERTWIGEAAKALCSCCGERLDLHQPDAERPDRLLGTCAECGAWFLIDDETHTMLAIPDVRAVRRN